MRAFRWRLVAALSPIIMAMAACDQGVVTTSTKGTVTTTQSRVSTTVAVTTRINNDSSFGSSVVRGGVTGVTMSRPTASTAPSAPPIYRATLNLTINGKPPGEWHDQRLLNPPKNIYLIPELKDQTIPTVFSQLTQNSLIEFSTLRRGTYHIVYSDENLPSNPETDAQGYKHLDMLGFFVTNAMYFDSNMSTTRTTSLDLYWETMASPNTSDARVGDDAHAYGQYTTYTDKFRTKPYRGIYIDSLPYYQQECNYRFVVSKSAGGLGDVVWQSQWHLLDPTVDPDFINVAWNGYSSRTSGPNDAPPEDDPNNRLPEGPYYFCIEFYPTYGRAPSGDFRTLVSQGANFISTYYGASQWYSFTLKHGIKPTLTVKTGASPTPTPQTSAAPVAQPTPIPTPTQFSL